MANLSNRIEQLSPLQRAALALKEMRTKLDAIESAQNEPIAIVGMGCRFPGANHPEAFWELLRDGVDMITEVPPERWDINAYYDSNPDAAGKVYTRYGSFLPQFDQFDPHFFGISSREAVNLDPQQRLLLEVTWEALENAGQSPKGLVGSATGVFIGIAQMDYGLLQLQDIKHITAYTGTGSGLCYGAGRLSYVLGLQGPVLSIDTACSSSLVAVHLACQSLRLAECHLAIVGGVHLNLSPLTSVCLSKTQALSPDGRCKTFDASANGMSRGEGCGVIILKRLSDAVANQDNILALIRGSAINHDGASSGFTVPNELAQEQVIRQALQHAKVKPAEVSYIEAHGTGTALGDPIEMGALSTVYRHDRTAPLIVGTVKTNLGHLEAAAGIVGLIKVVLALQHEEIPPHLHFKQPSPHIAWDVFPVIIPTERQAWPRGQSSRIAGVSSFGMSGTNAHLLLAEAPALQEIKPVQKGHQERPLHLLTLSAKSDQALYELAEAYQTYFQTHSTTRLVDVCFTANTGRAHFDHRLALVADSIEQLGERLAQIGEVGKPDSGKLNPIPPKIAFLFTGQGSQYIGMGRQLYDTQPTFRKTLEHCDEILRPYLGTSLLKILYPEQEVNPKLDETAYTQPALFALEYALAQLWLSWGITPSAVMGHSVGEYVAACIAGVFSLEDGLKLIAERGRLMQALPQDGMMVVLSASEAQVATAIQAYAPTVSIAAINGPQNVVISGARQALKTIMAALNTEGIKTKPLKVSHAFHSPLMEAMVTDFQRVAAEVTYAVPKIDFISNLSGEWVNREVTDADYWCRHILSPVQFAKSMATLSQQAYDVFIEIGPQTTLLGMASQCLPAEDYLALPSLRPEQSDWQQMLQSLAQLYVRGVSIDWAGFDRDYVRRRVVLPTYPFQRQRYWINKSEPTKSLSQPVETSIIHLIRQGDVEQLAQQLTQAGQFSAESLPLLETLVKQHQQQLKFNTIKDWFYQLSWQPKPHAPKDHQSRGSWLIFADKGGIGQTLAQYLQERDQTCFLVYAKTTDDQLEDYGFSKILDANVPPLKGIVHLWSLDIAPSEQLNLQALEQAQILGCGSVLHLIQSLVKRADHSASLWLVTQKSVPVTACHLSGLAQSPLWGLGKVVALEHPEIWGGMIDLAPVGDHAAMLLSEILTPDTEDLIAYQDGERYVARLVPNHLTNFSNLSLVTEASYLITGGLGVLGLRVAEWLISQGARHLILISRRQASKATQETINQLRQKGAEILIAPADVANQSEISSVFETIANTMPPLRGIIHAAGVLGFEAMTEMTLKMLQSVMRPKVQGAWILHQFTQTMSLDFFVCFSSIASVWGSKGQAHYAAANHFLDILAHYRHQLGLPALTINWGPWAKGGMASEKAQTWLNRQGVEALPPQLAIEALSQLLGTPVCQSTVAQVNWSLFQEIYALREQRPLLEKIKVPQTVLETSQSTPKSAILAQLKTAPKGDGYELLSTYLQTEVTQVLGVEFSQWPTLQQGFFEMGMDSLMAVELKKRLVASLETTLPATLVFDYPNLQDLTEYLGHQVFGWEVAENQAVSTEQLPDDELEASIAEQLAKLESLL
jgi:malonyl CoA-acyl carrier protein transacylase